ncbi:MAG TPA: Xaa-Pro peptidase family protein [Acetobacteraceae bacterium]|nr:Xaa-Pro peptidase family protein [Acetobacteraceae bacterium]
MSKHDFAPEEFADRLTRLRQAIGAAGLDWLLVLHPVSIRWLIGQDTKSYTVFQCLPVSAKPGKLIMFTRGTEEIEFAEDTMADELRLYNGREPEDPMEPFSKFLDELGIRGSRVGMEVPGGYLQPGHYVRLKSMLGDALVQEPCGILMALRAVKSPAEIAYIREAARIGALALDSMIDAVGEGVSELELAAVAYHTLLSNGSGLPASTMNLMTGERSAYALGGPTDRRMRHGDTGLVEMGAARRRYTATLGRQWTLGPPSNRLLELHNVIRHASDACLAEMRDGQRAVVPHEAAKRVIAEAGLDQYRAHTTGYGMAPGFPPSWGEGPNMFGGSADVLRAGMVVSVEPAVFLAEERLGVRLIDNVIITKDGVERLTMTSRDLIVVE